jgi:hypothetical protein
MEVWKSIEGYETLYEVSNFGNVKSLNRQVLGKLTSSTRNVKERILKPKTSKYGYLEVSLHKEGKLSTKRVNRLVAIAFIINVNNYPQVNHINGDKLNNNIDNLEWVSNSMNQIHAHKIGLKRSLKGENSNRAILTNEKVLDMKNKYESGSKIKDLHKEFGIKYTTCWHIIKGNGHSLGTI